MMEADERKEETFHRLQSNTSVSSTLDGENKTGITQVEFSSETTYEINKSRVGPIHEAPIFLRDNEYIKHGYRINFDSTKQVVKSLFILHNESVNIWSHLCGVLLVIIFICYTTVFISSHKEEIFSSLNLNVTSLNEEIKHVTDPVIKLIPNLKNITHDLEEKYESSKHAINSIASSIVDKTAEYISKIDDKIGVYQKYQNCKDCFDDIIHTIGKVKDSLGGHVVEYTHKIVNSSIHLIEQIEESPVGHFLEDFNTLLGNIKNKTADLMTNDDTWTNLYSLEGKRRLTRWPVFVMLFSAIICLGCSALFHWFMVHSRAVHNLLNRLDYAGISILIAGSSYPPYYYFFYCEAVFRFSYLAFITIFALSVFFYSLKPEFTTPSKRKLRGFLFLTLGLSTGLPMIHLALLSHTIKGFYTAPSLFYWYLGGISYVTGALIYIARFPEKFRPGKHDIWGSSHQIFHFFVVLGVIFHYLGCLDSYYYRVNNSCPI